MQIERSHRPTEAPLVAELIPVSFSTEQTHRDMLVASSTPKRGGMTIGSYVKALLTKIYNAILELFSMCAIEPSRLEIIEGMLYDSKGQSKDFAAHFQENLNACVQAAFYDPGKVTELLEENKKKYKSFCIALNKELRKKDLIGKLQDQKAAVTKALSLMWDDISQDDLKTNGAADILKDKIPTVGRVIIGFCNEMKLILESSRHCEENLKPQLQALKNLVSDFIPRVALEMTKQPSAFTKFITSLVNAKDFKADTIIKLLADNIIIQNLAKKKDFLDIKACFGGNNRTLDLLGDKDYAAKFGIKHPPCINYTMTFLQAITVEQFETLLPALITKGDLNADLRKGVVEVFRQIKSTEEPITEERLGKALELLDQIYTNFENYKTIDERDGR